MKLERLPSNVVPLPGLTAEQVLTAEEQRRVVQANRPSPARERMLARRRRSATIAASLALGIGGTWFTAENVEPTPGVTRCGIGIVEEGQGAQAVVGNAAANAHVEGHLTNKLDAGEVINSLNPTLHHGERFQMLFDDYGQQGSNVRIDTIVPVTDVSATSCQVPLTLTPTS